MTHIDIFELSNLSGDSQLVEYVFKNNILTIFLDLYDEKKIKILIKTDSIFTYDLENSINPVINNCRVIMKSLVDILDVKNGYYVPASDFGKFMKETKNCCNLAYGRKSNDFSWLFSVSGYEVLIACLIKNSSDVSVIELI